MSETKVINVQPGMWGRVCRMFGKPFKRCKRVPKFMIFGDDGRQKSSRFEGCVCEQHLAAAVRALKKRQEDEDAKNQVSTVVAR